MMLMMLAVVIVAGGCGRGAAKPSGPKPFQVALLTPGPVSDAGWNAAAYDGLQLIKQKLGAETALVQTQSPADFDDAMRDFASRGFDLVFAHGFEYSDSALKIGRLFPNTIFLVTSGSVSSANVASLTFKIEEAAYVEGVVAGVMSRSGVAGAIGGIELPSIRLTFEGFRRGFISTRPDGRLLISYTGSFDDVGAAKEAAMAQIIRHADVLVHNADAAGLGVFQAAQQGHAYAFGANRNQNSIAPTVIIASAVTDIPDAFLKIAAEVKAHNFRTGMLEYGMEDGMVNVVFNPALASKIPAEAIQKANTAEQQIREGKLTVAPPTAPTPHP